MAIGVAAAFTATAILAGCGGQPSAQGAKGVTSPSAGAVSGLIAKPLRLPKLSPGAPCPVAPVSNVRLPVASPRGGPNFYLGGPNPHGGYAWNKTVYALIGAKGPVLLRGARLDGDGTLKFDGPAADQREPGETLSSHGGVARTFYAAVLLPGAIQQNGSTADVFYLYPSSPGCYGLQADGDGFEDVVVFLANA